MHARGQVITFVTSEGLVNLSDSQGLFEGLTVRVACLTRLHSCAMSSRRQSGNGVQAHQRQPRLPAVQRQLPTVEEQGICIGQTFLVAASNGRDLSRRVQVLGFCRSVDLVSEVLSGTV